MEEAIKKSEVLIEALPYIKKFFDKVVVIKFGGSMLHDKAARLSVLQDIVFMRYAGMKCVLVHGGGPGINRALEEAKIETEFKDGLRVTCARSMAVVDSVLGGITKSLVEEVKQLGGSAFGLSGKENKLIQAKRRDNPELGFVGEVERVDTTIVKRLIDTNMIPVIAPVGTGPDGALFNVNADEVASSIATSLQAEKFVILTNVLGVMKDPEDDKTLHHTLRLEEVRGMIEHGIIAGGMSPKTIACIHALEGNVNKAHIVGAQIPHALLLEMFTDEGIGTQIIH